jgi:hypothetical protein
LCFSQKINGVIDERYDPEKSIKAHEKHIYYLSKKANGSLEHTLALYLLGETQYKKLGLSNLSGQEFYDKLPLRDRHGNNVKRYVTEIIALSNLLRNKEIEYQEQPLFSEKLANTKTVKVKRGQSIASIARKHNKKINEIKEVNLEIRKWNHIRPGQPINIPID